MCVCVCALKLRVIVGRCPLSGQRAQCSQLPGKHVTGIAPPCREFWTERRERSRVQEIMKHLPLVYFCPAAVRSSITPRAHWYRSSNYKGGKVHVFLCCSWLFLHCFTLDYNLGGIILLSCNNLRAKITSCVSDSYFTHKYTGSMWRLLPFDLFFYLTHRQINILIETIIIGFINNEK